MASKRGKEKDRGITAGGLVTPVTPFLTFLSLFRSFASTEKDQEKRIFDKCTFRKEELRLH